MPQPDKSTDAMAVSDLDPGHNGARNVVTHAVEDYVKAIYKLQHESQSVSTNDIARILNTSPAAVTKMTKHLAARNLLTRVPYYGVRLTNVGEKIALETIRHHRLLELYLVQALGYGWDEVDAEAERLEHHISEEFEERIDQLLGRPATDPHGDPIPTREGIMPGLVGERLSEARRRGCLIVTRVSDRSPDALRELAALGVRLGSRLELLAPSTDGQPLIVRVDGEERRILESLASLVFAQSVEPTHGEQ